MITVGSALEVLEGLWPASDAELWDKPGLVAGNTESALTGILLSVDLTNEVVDEALALGANLIISHHPFLLKGVHSVAEDTLKGELLVKLVRANVAAFAAHTNADIAADGVSAAIAQAIGLSAIEPLTSSGHGRVGQFEQPVTLGEFVDHLLQVFPSTVRGISASADPERNVSRVALCGGAGDSFITEAQASGADVYVTSDLRHHITQDSKIALVDVSHWAAESLWLPVAAKVIGAKLATPIHVSGVQTDPWVFRRNNEGNN